MLIYIDTREKQYEHISGYFQEIEQPFVRKCLPFGDYASEESHYVVERKRSILELSSNAGRFHSRFSAELKKAQTSGKKLVIIVEEPYKKTAKAVCERALKKVRAWLGGEEEETIERIKIMLVSKINAADDLYAINYWASKRSEMQGDTLYKHCLNYINYYGVSFVFCDKKDSGRIIVDILSGRYKLKDEVPNAEKEQTT